MKRINLREREEKIIALMKELPVNFKWFVITMIWMVLGTYAYNVLLPLRNWITQLLYYGLTFFLLWQNRHVVFYFFRNPFKHIDKSFVFSSVLWVIPFTILMASVPLVLIPQALGWISSDPQKFNEMSISIDEYLRIIAIIPIGVIQEEAINVLLLMVVSKWLSSRMNKRWFILAVVLSSVVFGGIHVTAWGMESAVSRMLMHIPFLFSVLYFRNAWPCVLAHLYQNCLTYTSIIVEDFSTMFVGYGTLLLIAILVFRSLVKRIGSRLGNPY